MRKKLKNRTSESEIFLGIAQIAALSKGSVRVGEINKQLPGFVKLTNEDNMHSYTRRNEPMFHQITRNIVSHRNKSGNAIHDGYLEYSKETKSIGVTEAGMQLLRSKGMI